MNIMKKLAVILSFSIACIGVCVASTPAAQPAPNAAASSASSKHPKKHVRKASLRTVAVRTRRKHYRHRYRRYRYRGPLHPSRDRVSEIQSALARSGYYKGNPNGKWDANTISAMRNFQEDHGINGTGKIDALSLQKLGLGSEIAGVDAPRPPAPKGSAPANQTNPAAAGQAVPGAAPVPGSSVKPQTPQAPQLPKAPGTGTGSGTGTPSTPGTPSATPQTSTDSSSKTSSH